MDERYKTAIEQYADEGYRAPFTFQRYIPNDPDSDGDVYGADESMGPVFLNLCDNEAELAIALLNDRPEFQPKDTD